MYQGCIPHKTKNRRPIDEIAPKKQKMYLAHWVQEIKNNLNTELKEMGVFSAVAGNHYQINCKKEDYRLSSTCGAPRNHTNVQPVDAHV